MVTIEQKLSLFSKLLNQELKDESNKKLLELDKEYEGKVAENKYMTDKEAADIIDNARKNAEAKRVELISKGRMSTKKETMLSKEKVVVRFMDALVERAKAFTNQPEYEAYLVKSIKELDEIKDYTNPLEINMSAKDLAKYKELVITNLVALGLKREQLSFNTLTGDVIGGFIINDPVLNMKIDMSMHAVIEESKEHIVELITLALGKMGETSE